MDGFVPLDEEWKYACARKTAVFGEGEPPPKASSAHGRNGPERDNAPTRELLYPVGSDGPGEEHRLAAEPLLHRFAVLLKPPGVRGLGRPGVDGDHLQVTALPQAKHPVVGPLGRMLASFLRPDTQSVEDIL